MSTKSFYIKKQTNLETFLWLHSIAAYHRSKTIYYVKRWVLFGAWSIKDPSINKANLTLYSLLIDIFREILFFVHL